MQNFYERFNGDNKRKDKALNNGKDISKNILMFGLPMSKKNYVILFNTFFNIQNVAVNTGGLEY